MKFSTRLTSFFLTFISCIIFSFSLQAQKAEVCGEISAPSNCISSPDPLVITQSDGTTISVVGKGNMLNHWSETVDGYSIAKNNSGIYEYAVKQNGKLIAGGTKASDPWRRAAVEQNYVSTIQPSLKPNLQSLKNTILSQVNARLQNKTYPTTGNIRVLALLIDYPNLANTYSVADFDSLASASHYRNGDHSFKTFYETSSNGQLTVTVDVFGWYRASKNYIHYGADSGYDKAADLVREAVDAAETAGVDFSLYDNDNDNDVDGILAVHSGPGAESGGQTQFVWSHRWVLAGGNLGSVTYDGVFINDYMINPETRGTLANPRLVGIGVFCHEFGHNLGLPDLYDTDATNGDSEGIGEWGLMGGGGWLGGEHQPSNFCAWSRIENNWDTAQVLTIGNTGIYNMSPASRSKNDIYQINTALTNEYFLLENRQRTGLDTALPGNGLAIWHINTTKTNSFGNSVNADENLKGVDLEEADGNDDLDHEVNRGDGGDLYPGTSNNNTFDDNSSPDANTYTLANTNIELRNIGTSGSNITFDFGAAPGPPCAASTTLTANTGSFDDGSGAGLDYVNNQTCTWLIQPASGTVTLSFSAFDIQAGDSVWIYDGPNASSTLLGSYSGNTIPPNSTSSSNSMFVEFITDATLNGPGWDASYTTSGSGPTCSGSTTLTAAMGNFSDGSGLANYSNNLNCSWLIQPAGAATITFGLSSLNTEINNDRIIIYDGPNNSAPQLGSYSGTNNLNTLTSSGGSIFVEFTTNGSVTDQGWDAFYSSSTSGPGCTGATTLTANSGSFSDGSMANNYDNNQFCSWLIQPTAGTITLSFSAFDTEATNDRVLVYDGIDNTAPQIGNFSGTTIPANLTSTSNSLYIEFRTNGTVTSQGWDASYTTSTSTPTCSGLTTLTAVSGSVDDGSGSGNNYSDNLNCTWLIQPTGATGVTLNFTTFNTELNNDILRIYNGTNNTGPLVATLSGTSVPPSVSVASGNMFLEFTTNGSVNSTGWSATYTSSIPPTCSGTTTLTTASGNFDDGSGANNYDNNLNCSWLIQPSNNPAVITLTMNSMNLANFGDRVRVYDGTNTGGTLIGSFFFNNTGNPVSAYSGSMFVEFTTDNAINANGWDASYSTSSTYCLPTTTLTGNFGNFTDGSPFGQNYLDNTDCEWLIQPTAPNVAINLTFNQFNTQLNDDTVTIYDGANTSAPIMATISGNNPTIPTLLSTGGDMLVTFKSNGSVTASGWRANYTTQIIPACSGTTTLTAATGTFDDGTNSTTNYAPNLNCSWLIQPAGAAVVSLSFNRFAVNNVGFGADQLSVYDGTSNTAPLLGSYTGSTLPPTLTSSGGSLFVEFTSNNFLEDLGWEASYNSSTSQCLSNQQILTYNGNLEDGSGTSNYQNNLNCSWVIQPPSATSITLTFNSFDVSDPGDTLFVYDGPNNTSTLLGSYTGTTIPAAVTSTGGDIFIEFITDGSTNSAGWDLTYSAATPFSCAGQTTLTATMGSFDDGSGSGNNYDNNLNCTWLIQPTNNPAVITLTMTSMNLANFGDRVRVYDGTSSAGTFLGTFFLNNTGNPLDAYSGSMFIEFVTDNNSTANGWDATYSTSSSYCQPSTTFTGNFGFFDDGSPFGQNYLDNTYCEWLIQPTAPNVAVRLTFFSFDTQSNNDSVSIYDGTSTNDPLLGTFSGTNIPPVITSSAGDMFITFSTDGSVTANGWSAQYATQPIPFCAGLTTLTAASGVFNDGSNNGTNYVQNSNCSWLISPPGALNVDLTFNRFDTEANFDFVSVYDGTDNTAPLLGTYSGATLPPMLSSNGGNMFIEFTTDGAVNNNGWEVSYTSSNVVVVDAAVDTVYINAGIGSTASFALNSNVSWTTSDNGAWLVATPINGNGNSTINLLAIQANIGPERSAEVFINSTTTTDADTVVVVQRTSGRFVTANPDTLYFVGTAAASQNVSLNANVNWTLTPSDTWITPSPTTGSNNGNSSISVQDNPTKLVRNAHIVVTGTLGASNDTVFIVQDTSTIIPSLSVDPKNITLAQTAGSNATFDVNSTVVWQTQSGATWLTVTNPASTRDSNTVQITANTANPGTSTRSTFVAVQDVGGTLFDTVFVNQTGSSLILSATPQNILLNQASGSNANVTLNANVTWTATPADSWLGVTPANGTTNAILTVQANSANSSAVVRSSYIALDGNSGAIVDTIFVDQQGTTPLLNVSPRFLTLAQAMNSIDSFIVNSNTMWQTTSGASWLTVNPPVNPSDTDTVQVIANSMNVSPAPRATYVAVQDLAGSMFDTVFVTQLGSLPILLGNPDTITLAGNSGSNGTLNVLASGNWTAVEGDTWFSASPTSGSGIVMVNLTANSDNSTGSSRISYVALADAASSLTDTVIIIQDTLAFGLLTTPDTIQLGAANGSTNTFNISAPSLSWSATPSDSWLSVSPNMGTGGTTATVTIVSANTSMNDRLAFIEVMTTSGPITLRDTVWCIQDGFQGNLTVNPTVVNLGFSSGSNAVITVTSDVNWTVTNPASWLSINPASGTNNGTFTITANSDNLSGLDRTATISVDGTGGISRTIDVTQIDGSTPTFGVSADTVFVDNPQGSTATFSVLSNASSWTLSENTSWLLVNPSTGSQTQSITVLVATRNVLGVPRYATITASSPGFANHIVVVAQLESTPLFQVAPANLMLGADSSSFVEFNISSNLTSWTITENASWLSVNPPVGAFTERIMATAIEKNTSGAQRTEMVTVSAPPLVPQSIMITQDTVRTIGIDENAFNRSLFLYPNPTSGEINIQIGSEFVGSAINTILYNTIGEEIPVHVDFSTNNRTTIDLSHYPNGIYYLRMQYKESILSRKISVLK